tara:strand:- start:593 stop:841 length:249 start_codon:yes stop_codon:yes gene_type:complete
MTKLFQSQNKEGFLININVNQSYLKEVLWAWLEENHNDIYWDIEMHEGGSIETNFDGLNGGFITFRGDNGIFELEEVEAENL